MAREWYVLYVKPRTDKKVAEYLRIYKIWHFMALYEKRRKVQRMVRISHIPVFPGYIFTRLNHEERQKMMRTNLIVRFIQPSLPRMMIHQLRVVVRAMRNAPSIIPKKTLCRVGDYVRIKYGPFRGVEGFVNREGPKATLCMNIDVLGSSVEVAIPAEDLEKV